MNLIGIWMTVITLLGIWSGHVAVRWLEYRLNHLWVACLPLTAAGLALLAVSTRAELPALSAGLGLAGIILVIDAVELIHQDHRVKIGRAPANPANPRHARILRKFPAAVTTNPLEVGK